MGHSLGKSVTELYLDNYPLKKQFEYNNKLLNIGNKSADAEVGNLTKEKATQLLMEKMGVSKEGLTQLLSKLAS